MGAQLDAAQRVGLVLLGRQRRRLDVGGILRQGIDGGAANSAGGVDVGVQRDEEVAAGLLRDPIAVPQGDEAVVGPRHDYPVAAALFQGVAQCLRVAQRQNLLVGARNPDRARVDAPVAGVDHHGRARVAGDRGRGRQRRPHARQFLARDEAAIEFVRQEGGAVGGFQIDYEPIALAVARRDREDFAQACRPGQIQHDAAGRRREEAVAQIADQAALLPGSGGRPVDLGQVDDDAVGVGQNEDAIGRRRIHLQHEAGELEMRADPHVGDLRFRHRRCGDHADGSHRESGYQAEQASNPVHAIDSSSLRGGCLAAAIGSVGFHRTSSIQAESLTGVKYTLASRRGNGFRSPRFPKNHVNSE